MADYLLLKQTISALVKGEADVISLMATLACEIHNADDRFHWTGFYSVVAPELMKIGPYQGGHGCLVIPFSRGVCGAAARLNETQLVDDVEEFEGHIACSSSTRSELVIPISDALGNVIGVLDIDSDLPCAFTQVDADELKAILTETFGTLNS